MKEDRKQAGKKRKKGRFEYAVHPRQGTIQDAVATATLSHVKDDGTEEEILTFNEPTTGPEFDELNAKTQEDEPDKCEGCTFRGYNEAYADAEHDGYFCEAGVCVFEQPSPEPQNSADIPPYGSPPGSESEGARPGQVGQMAAVPSFNILYCLGCVPTGMEFTRAGIGRCGVCGDGAREVVRVK